MRPPAASTPQKARRPWATYALTGIAVAFVLLWLVASIRPARHVERELPAECALRYSRARTAADTAVVDVVIIGGGRSVATSCGMARQLARTPAAP